MKIFDILFWRLVFSIRFVSVTDLNFRRAWVTSKFAIKLNKHDTNKCPIEAANIEAKSFRNFIRNIGL